MATMYSHLRFDIPANDFDRLSEIISCTYTEDRGFVEVSLSNLPSEVAEQIKGNCEDHGIEVRES